MIHAAIYTIAKAGNVSHTLIRDLHTAQAIFNCMVKDGDAREIRLIVDGKETAMWCNVEDSQ